MEVTMKKKKIMQTSHKAIPNKTANLHTLAKRGTENTIQINPNYI
jgi:hypothetical protein